MADPRDTIAERLLVVQCQAGDERAFEDLVVRYRPRLAYYLRKVLGGSADADDAIQDVWIAVFQGIGRLRSPGSFRPWLYRIARDRAFGELRRRRRLPRPAEIDEETAEAPEPEFTAEDASRIHAGLDELSPEHREALVLRFLEDMSYEEIAAATGCCPGTARSRLHYAKIALRRALERMERPCTNGTSERNS